MNELEKLQLVEKEMLFSFDLLCQKYCIDYFVLFGTALGAVRHQGFIPWDDDIDIGMLRSDYEKLKKIPAEEWGNLILVEPGSELIYHEKIFPRIYKPGTVLEFEKWTKYVRTPKDIKKPVWLDIFLFDYVDSKEEALDKAKKAHMLNMQYYYSRYMTNVVPRDPLKEKVRSLAKIGIHYCFRAFHTPEYYLQKYYDLVQKESGEFIISFDSWRLGTIMDTFGKPEMYFPVKRMKFDDIEVSVPNDVDSFLKQRFGDYMKLPPEDQRKAHIPISVYLGED